MAEITEKSAPKKAQPALAKKTNMSAEELVEKYKKPVLIGIVALVALVGAFTFYKYNQSENNAVAQTEMYQAVFFFEQDSFEMALIGSVAKKVNKKLPMNILGQKRATLLHFIQELFI